MRHITIVFSVIIMLSDTVSSFAWGPMGHDVVAAIAEKNLTRKAKKNLHELLDGKSIVYYSSWMDNLRNSPNWKDGYDKTKTWHYANVDEGCTYQTMPKHEKGDVITALTYLTKELMENQDSLTDSLRADYVKMIVHMVGDLHCPMHAGRLSDRGGNGVIVKWFGQKTKLHSVFDSKLLESSRKWGYQEWVEQLDRADRKFRKSIVQGTYEDWFKKTVNNAFEIYEYIERLEAKEPNLSYQFIYDFSPMLEESLLLGGYRLAHVLNMIFG